MRIRHLTSSLSAYLFVSFFLYFLNQPLWAQPTGFSDNLVSNDFVQPTAIQWDANGRMYVAEKCGKVWIVENGIRRTTPLLDISQEVGDWRAYGLVGFALDPNFLSNGFIYLCYVVDRHHLLYFGTPQYDANANEYYNATIGRVTRYTARAADNFRSVEANSRRVLIGETPQMGMPVMHESHGVGCLQFGSDGTLLVAFGDGASYNAADVGNAFDTYHQQALADGIIPPDHNIGAYRCQLLTSFNGKIVRINPLTGDGLPSNPFYEPNNPRSVRSRVWAYGLRNPYQFCRRPGTGSSLPAAGNPGTLYIGDVGWNADEELNVCTQGGQNFGWPRFEGMTYQPPSYNNPLYAPAVHTLPKVDWRTNTPRGNINGNITPLGSWNFQGTSFEGNCSIGGFWYTHGNYPATYQNTYFHADYGGQWIKSFSFDYNNNPTAVRDFKSNAGAVVYLTTHPTQGDVWYINFPNEIRRIVYNDGNPNRSPVAKATATTTWSANDTLTVQFYGDQSYDQNGDTLSYEWNFGDGTTSNAMNPTHRFVTTATTPVRFEVTLTVRDPGQAASQDALAISLRNTPPVIAATSIDNINTYQANMGGQLNLSATVTDAEHTANQLNYVWEAIFYHNNHAHPDPLFYMPSVVARLFSVSCDGLNTYWYTIKLTVTDPMGLTATRSKNIYPSCLTTNQTITFDSIPTKRTTDAPFSLQAAASSNLPISFYVLAGPATLTGNTVTLTGIPGEVTLVATQHGNPENGVSAALPVFQTFTVLKNGNGVPLPPDNGNGNPATTPIDLSLALGIDQPAPPIYSHVVYTTTLRNSGIGVANNIRVNIPYMSSALAFSSSTASKGNFNGVTKNWEISALAPNEVATLSLRLFTLQPTLPTLLVQVQAAAQTDTDSAPNNNYGTTPNEDDEATIQGSGSGTSTPCNLTATVSNMACNTNTTTATTDDTYNFYLTVNGTGSSNTWQTTLQGVALTGTIGQARLVEQAVIAQGDLQLTIRDSNNAACTTTVTVVPPPPCSPATPPSSATDCAAQSTAPWQEWIQQVQLNTLHHTSSKSTYSDFKHLKTTLQKGVNYPLTLTNGFSWTGYPAYWRVWIDYNQNGIYEDTEVVAAQFVAAPPSGTLSSATTLPLTIPATALTGNTTMRVSSNREAYALPCGIFTYGEVEDYTVQIAQNLLGNTGHEGDTKSLRQAVPEVYPNPTYGHISVHVGAYTDDPVQLTVYNTIGIAVKTMPAQGSGWTNLDLSDLEGGMYYLKVESPVAMPHVIPVLLIR